MVLVLGHTACGAIKGATSTYLQSKTGNAPQVGDTQSMFEAVDFTDMMSIMWGGVYNLFIYTVGPYQIW